MTLKRLACSYDVHQGNLEQAEAGLEAAKAFMNNVFKKPLDAAQLQSQVCSAGSAVYGYKR